MSGSKARQVEEFPLTHVKELIFGRDPSSTVKYDPDKDDLVGRQHAKIVQDPTDPTQFLIVDLNSRNGTFINRQRLVGSARIAPGDTVQFGAGGPEFQFDLEPRPQQNLRPTRVGGTTAPFGSGVTAPPPTRTASTMPSPPPTYPATAAPGTVGKATVERMIAHNQNQSRKLLILGGAAVMVVIALIAAFLVYQNISSRNQAASDISGIKGEMAAAEAGKPMSPADIVNNYTSSVVFIEVAWKLIYTPTGEQVYHEFVANNFKGQQIIPNNRAVIPAYVLHPDDTIEPKLTLDSRRGEAIGGRHTGSGFTVTSDGFILTNRHVAATWKTTYHFPYDDPRGVIVQGGQFVLGPNGYPLIVPQAPGNWVPSETRQGRQQLQGDFEGRNDIFNVTFAKTDLRVPAKLARVSDRHDVAMLKVDVPEAVNKVELNDNYDTIKPGDGAIVLGYPAVSPRVYGVTKSQDIFNRETQYKVVPDPTVSIGNIGRVIRGQENPTGGKDQIISSIGDAYQLTINSTGSGNSGGPVFDDRGRVIGIFFASSRQDAMITFAVPIRYGKELMSVGAR
jgi:S1-C subfamily serine protease